MIEPTTRPLTAKRDRFCREYLVDLNGAQAAIRSGYARSSANVEGARLLADARIQDRIAELQAQAAGRAGLTVDDIVEELRKLAFWRISSVTRFTGHYITAEQIDEDEDGVEIKTVRHESSHLISIKSDDEIDDAGMAGIASIKVNRDGQLQITGVSPETKRAALVDLGRHLGMWAKDDQSTEAKRNKGDADAMTDDELATIARERSPANDDAPSGPAKPGGVRAKR